MALADKKITGYSEGVSALPNYPSDAGYTAERLKAVFDARSDGEIKDAINGIIDELISSEAAGQINCKSGKSIENELSDVREKLLGKAENEAPEISESVTVRLKDKPWLSVTVRGDRLEIFDEMYNITTALYANSADRTLRIEQRSADGDEAGEVITTLTHSWAQTAREDIDALKSHAKDKTNPHEVAASQLALADGETVEEAIDALRKKEIEAITAKGIDAGVETVTKLYAKDGRGRVRYEYINPANGNHDLEHDAQFVDSSSHQELTEEEQAAIRQKLGINTDKIVWTGTWTAIPNCRATLYLKNGWPYYRVEVPDEVNGGYFEECDSEIYTTYGTPELMSVGSKISAIEEELTRKQDKRELALIETIIVGYSKIDAETAPEWVADTYYKNTGSAIEPKYKLTTAKPSDWETSWQSYFTYSPDGVVAVDRTEEPDGTPYDFDACYVDANILQGETTGTGGIVFYPSTGSGGAMIGRAYIMTAVRTNIAVRHECLTYKLFGRWHTPSYISAPQSNGASIAETSNMPGMIAGHSASAYPSIKRARISCSGTVWPSGSTIKIYGVRRNED